MGWELHRASTAFPKFAMDWDRLNSELFDCHPYFDSRFIGPLLKHFSTGKEILCLHRTEDCVDGALILQPKGYGRWISFRPSQAQITTALIRTFERVSDLFPVLPGFAWTIEFLAIDPRYAPSLEKYNLGALISAQAYTIGINSHANFKAYWDARPKKLRSNIQRYLKRIEIESRSVLISKLSNLEEMSSAVTRFGTLESAGWKGLAGTAISDANAQGAFYKEVMRNFAASREALVYELMIDGHLAASRLLIGNARMIVCLKTTYNENHARLAPGRVMLYRVLEDSLTNHSESTIEFYTNATQDQREWATFGCSIVNLQLFKNRFFASSFSLIKGLRNALRISSPCASHPEGLEVGVASDVNSLETREVIASLGFKTGALETRLDWFGLLQKTVYPNDSGVRYYYSAKETKASVILPLRFSKSKGVTRIEALSNFYTTLFTPLKSDEADSISLKYLLIRATEDQKHAHVMRFAPMDPNSLAYHELYGHLLAIGWIPFKFFCFANWYLKLEKDWEDYFSHRSANLRSKIRRKTRHFVAVGGTLDVVSDPEQIDGAIAAFQEVYSSSWKIPEPYPDFVPSLIRHLATIGMLRLGVACLDNKPIAAQIWIVEKSKASIYKVAYHEDFASFSPGTILTSHLMQHVIEKDHVSEVDFLIGDDEYKRIWMSDRRERWGIVAYNPRTFIGLALLLRELAARSMKVVRHKFNTVFNKKASNCHNRPQKRPESRGLQLELLQQQEDADMNWEILPASRFTDYATQWDSLIRNQPGTPFLESHFLQPAIEAFGTGEEKLCLLRTNGKLRAGAIMKRKPKGVWETFQPSQLPLGAWVTDKSLDVLKICDELAKRLPGAVFGIGLSQIDPRLQTRPNEGPRIRSQDYIQTAWVDIDRDFDTYWADRGKNLKQNMRKQRNKLEGEGIDTRIEIISDPADVAKAIEEYGRLESTGWKAADRTAIHPDNDQGRFYRKMLKNFCALGRGRIYQMRFNDKIVAMDLCIQDSSVIVILKTAYDETFKTVSPSTLMRQQQFQQLFDEKKFSRIEFFGKVMEWHSRWTQKSRTLFHLTVYRWTLLKKFHARTLSIPEIQNEEVSTQAQ